LELSGGKSFDSGLAGRSAAYINTGQIIAHIITTISITIIIESNA